MLVEPSQLTVTVEDIMSLMDEAVAGVCDCSVLRM